MSHITIVKKKTDYRPFRYEDIPTTICMRNIERLNESPKLGREQLRAIIRKYHVNNLRHLAFVRKQAMENFIEALFTPKQRDSYAVIDKHIQYLNQWRPQVSTTSAYRRPHQKESKVNGR